MTEPHLETGAYALDSLDDVARRAVERHLGACPECAAEVRDFHEATGMLAARVAEPPPAQLRAAVLARVAVTRQLAPETRARFPRVSPRGLLAVAAAAVLVVGAALGGVAWETGRADDQARVEAALVARVMNDPTHTVTAGRPVVGGAASVVAAHGAVVFSADRLPAAPAGHDYQLWVLHGRAVDSAGVLVLHEGAAQTVLTEVPQGATVAVSVEPEGGSVTPTTDPVLTLEVA